MRSRSAEESAVYPPIFAFFQFRGGGPFFAVVSSSPHHHPTLYPADLDLSSMPTALVTGANRGIGLGLVKKLHGKGYAVFAVCRCVAVYRRKNPRSWCYEHGVSDGEICAVVLSLGRLCCTS